MSNNTVKFTMELRILSPVHIGNGSKYSKLDFIFAAQKKQAGLLDERAWLNWLIRHRLLESYTEAVQRLGERMDNFQFLIQHGYTDPLKQCRGTFSAVLYINQSINTLNAIAQQLKDVYHCPYIPGSSLKGAFRTAVLTALIRNAYEQGGEKEKQLAAIWGELTRFIQDPRLSRPEIIEKESQRILKMVDTVFFNPLHLSNGDLMDAQLADPFRGLKIDDSQPFAQDSIIIVKKHDLAVPVGKNPVSEISLWRESIRPGSVTRFSVMLDRTHLEQTGLDMITDAGSLMRCLKIYRNIVLDRHEKILTEDIKRSPLNSDYNLKVIPAIEGYAAFTLGGGTGFQGKSLIYALAPDEKKANQLVEVLLEKQFPGKHKGRDTLAAPRTIKTTRLVSKDGVSEPGRYKLGICAVREV